MFSSNLKATLLSFFRAIATLVFLLLPVSKQRYYPQISSCSWLFREISKPPDFICPQNIISSATVVLPRGIFSVWRLFALCKDRWISPHNTPALIFVIALRGQRLPSFTAQQQRNSLIVCTQCGHIFSQVLPFVYART